VFIYREKKRKNLKRERLGCLDMARECEGERTVSIAHPLRFVNSEKRMI